MNGGLAAQVYGRAYSLIFRHFPPYQRLCAELIAQVDRTRDAGTSRADVQVLDLACGPGDLAFAFAAAGYSVCGIDPFGVLLEIARRRGRRVDNARFQHDVVGEGRTFDVVLNIHALYVDAAWRDRLRLAHRALRPGGVGLFANFAAPISFWGLFREEGIRGGVGAAATSLMWLLPNAVFEATRSPSGGNYWSEDVFAAHLTEVGFEIVDIRRTFLADTSVLVVARKRLPQHLEEDAVWSTPKRLSSSSRHPERSPSPVSFSTRSPRPSAL